MRDYIDRMKAVTSDLWSDATCPAQVLMSLPAADVAPVRHGRWKQCFEDWRKQIEGDECSVCGFQHYGTSIGHYNYCPNCGAKMDLEARKDEI